MTHKLSCVMLIDDNSDDNFFHEREIKKNLLADLVIIINSATEALEYLKLNTAKNLHPELIFLDINMPGMNGWEFLQEYSLLDNELQSSSRIIMLTTSDNLEDVERAKKWSFVYDYKTKPLTSASMSGIILKHFQGIALTKSLK